MFISYHCRYCWLCTSLSPLGIPIIVGMYNNIYIYILLPAKPKIDRKSEGNSSTTSLINVYHVISFYILFDFFGRYYPPSSKIPLGSGTPKSVSWPVTSLDLTGSGSGCLQMRKRHQSYREHNWSNDLFVLWCSYDVKCFVYATIWYNLDKNEASFLVTGHACLGTRHPVADFEGAPHPRPGKSLVVELRLGDGGSHPTN